MAIGFVSLRSSLPYHAGASHMVSVQRLSPSVMPYGSRTSTLSAVSVLSEGAMNLYVLPPSVLIAFPVSRAARSLSSVCQGSPTCHRGRNQGLRHGRWVSAAATRGASPPLPCAGTGSPCWPSIWRSFHGWDAKGRSRSPSWT